MGRQRPREFQNLKPSAARLYFIFLSHFIMPLISSTEGQTAVTTPIVVAAGGEARSEDLEARGCTRSNASRQQVVRAEFW